MLRLACLAVALIAGPAHALVDLERVSFDSAGDGVVARIQTSERVRAYSVDQVGGSLEVVLYRTRLSSSMRQEAAQGPVRGYQFETGPDRVTLRFEADPSFNVRAYPDRESDDLLLSFARSPRPRSDTWGSGVVRVEPEPVVTSRGPFPGGERVDVPEGGENWRLDTIVLDAGHGGSDPGGVGIGITDRDIGFAVVNLLGPMIERELGINVVYTRETDVFVEVRERGRIANREGGKLFISVHGNVGPEAAYGTETFFLAPRGSGNAREVMERENSVIELESDPSLYADFHDEGDILASLAMSAYQEESQYLASLIEREFVRAGRRSRGVKQDNFMVLWAASMPAVLVEVGFLTNPDEARYLRSEEGQVETARAILEAVRQYQQAYEQGLGG
ncbi:N-acetylmuramoyl-L-alanine amidase family protein [Rubrivirga sp.]|uniref:N-acetylmuramoyl-L-alanine amidase family protein n=1 Tax=Rubrivirga sp. TaxID=1885344 RepID=UPI003C7769FA